MGQQFKANKEMYSHHVIWRAAENLLEQSKLNIDGGYYNCLSSLLMYYLAYEAFVNFIGQVLLPDLWKDEKENFKGKGLEGKIEKICQRTQNFQWEKGCWPYQKIKELEDFRDKVVHAKLEKSEYSAPFDTENGSHNAWKMEWDKYFSDPKKINEYRSAIKEFCESLRSAVNASFPNPIHPQLIRPAFEGSLGHVDGSLT